MTTSIEPSSHSKTLHSILPLKLDNICYQVDDDKLINNITTELHAGSRTVILGANGAGKSLFLRLCHGLISPTSGNISWQHPVPRTVRTNQAMVFQRPVLLRRSVYSNLNYCLSLHNIPRKQRKKLINNSLRWANLLPLSQRPARVLSSGEQQRLALCRAWLLKPKVIFLDEPTANLDPGSSKLVENMINTIHNSGTKIIMTTHDLAQAKRLADDVLFIHEGRLVEKTPAQQFFTQPHTEAASLFLKGDFF